MTRRPSVRTLAALAGSRPDCRLRQSGGLEPSAGPSRSPTSLAAADTLARAGEGRPLAGRRLVAGLRRSATRCLDRRSAGRQPDAGAAPARASSRPMPLVRAADAARQPQLGAGASVDRQRYSENGIFPPPIAGATLTTGQLAANFSYQFDFWGRAACGARRRAVARPRRRHRRRGGEADAGRRGRPKLRRTGTPVRPARRRRGLGQAARADPRPDRTARHRPASRPRSSCASRRRPCSPRAPTSPSPTSASP